MLFAKINDAVQALRFARRFISLRSPPGHPVLLTALMSPSSGKRAAPYGAGRAARVGDGFPPARNAHLCAA